MVNAAAGNRDPEVYDEPHRLDITRKGAAPMQTFGAGAHYCLGANLARRELAEALVVMTSRMTNIRRAGPRSGSRWSESPARRCCRSNSTLAVEHSYSATTPRAYTSSVREVLDELLTIWRAGGTAGVATVVRTIRSAPRQPGASMVVAPDGRVAGSVSGGCVEAAVYDLANEVAHSGRPELQRYGISDNDAFAVGLTCGGIIDIFAEPVSRNTFPQLQAIADDLAAHRATSVATVIAHPDPQRLGWRLVIGPHSAEGSLGSARADAAVIDDARGLLAAGRTDVLSYGPDGERQDAGMEVFVATHAPRPRMLIFGAIDFAAALARQGAFLGYRVTVCDARPVFATKARFPVADEVVVDWPHRYLAAQAERGAIDSRTAICALTHDPKFDVPVLQIGPTAAPGGLHRRDGLAPHPRRPNESLARGRADRRRAGQTVQPDRP